MQTDMFKTSGMASFLIILFQFLQYYIFVVLSSDAFALFHWHFYCDPFTREENRMHSKAVWQLLLVFNGPDLHGNLSDWLKIMDPSFITCEDIDKLLFCHKLKIFEAPFWPL